MSKQTETLWINFDKKPTQFFMGMNPMTSLFSSNYCLLPDVDYDNMIIVPDGSNEHRNSNSSGSFLRNGCSFCSVINKLADTCPSHSSSFTMSVGSFANNSSF
jgi:hypothetical protein